ncbi:endonuclease/exonuclease/phosphatase family protein [Pedobacter sp. ASV1-7]|uniref:endonuclease/exonuclease/phosphatase family protein n=1 Tax=Pedobacter sp. ASV1-7 TaxID=3145237 RepID=UPI0032E85CB6
MRNKLLCLLLSGVLLLSAAYAQTNKPWFKVLSYNIQEGLKKDSVKRNTFIRWADKVDADVIALQEVNHYTNADLEKLGKEMNYPYTALLKERGYPVALISRYPIRNIKRVADQMLHGYLYGEIKGYHFIVLHLNPFDYRKRNDELSHVFEQINALPKSSKILIMGDFNSLSPQDSLNYNYNRRKLEMLVRHEASRPNIKNVNNGKFDYSVIQSLLSAGFVDSWKLMNPSSFEKSAPTPIMKADRDQYVRIDYIWASKRLAKRIAVANIIKDEITDRLSDHYPMILTLKK